MKRVMLLIGTNLAIMLVLGLVSTLTGTHRFFNGVELDLGRLLFFALLMGFGGTFISLWMSKTLAKCNDEHSGSGIDYTVTVVICDIVFGILASLIAMYFSRQREFRSDACAAQLLGSPRPMTTALANLSGRVRR